MFKLTFTLQIQKNARKQNNKTNDSKKATNQTHLNYNLGQNCCKKLTPMAMLKHEIEHLIPILKGGGGGGIPVCKRL